MSWKSVKSGGKLYTIETFNDGEMIVRRYDTSFKSNGTRLGSTYRLSSALEIIKADSGGRDTDIRDF